MISKYLECVSFAGSKPCVDPRHFYSAPSKLGGVGLFCSLDLQEGDIWYLNDPEDKRYINAIVKVDEDVSTISEDWFAENMVNPVLWHFDFFMNRLVSATEPFCRINHSIKTRNTAEDCDGNDYILEKIPAGHEILISYDYESVFSLAWKFKEFDQLLYDTKNRSDKFLRQPVIECQLAMEFLAKM